MVPIGNIMLAAVGKGQCPDKAHDMDLLVVKNTMESSALDKERADTTLRICLVDAGMVAQLTDDESTNFIGTSSRTLTTSRKAIGPRPMFTSQSASCCGMFSLASTKLNSTALVMM